MHSFCKRFKYANIVPKTQCGPILKVTRRKHFLFLVYLWCLLVYLWFANQNHFFSFFFFCYISGRLDGSQWAKPVCTWSKIYTFWLMFCCITLFSVNVNSSVGICIQNFKWIEDIVRVNIPTSAQCSLIGGFSSVLARDQLSGKHIPNQRIFVIWFSVSCSQWCSF